MQFVGRAFGSVAQTWNSINPAYLSGAIDVIVVEQENGELAGSPFHVRFGKFSSLRPNEKKVELKVNGSTVPYLMKLGEGGEAFFVFQTTSDVPVDLQTSPLISPSSSPLSFSSLGASSSEPDELDIGQPSISAYQTNNVAKSVARNIINDFSAAQPKIDEQADEQSQYSLLSRSRASKDPNKVDRRLLSERLLADQIEEESNRESARSQSPGLCISMLEKSLKAPYEVPRHDEKNTKFGNLSGGGTLDNTIKNYETESDERPVIDAAGRRISILEARSNGHSAELQDIPKAIDTSHQSKLELCNSSETISHQEIDKDAQDPSIRDGTVSNITTSMLATRLKYRLERELEQDRQLGRVPAQITESGDIVLDTRGYKYTDEEISSSHSIAKRILCEELCAKTEEDIDDVVNIGPEGNLYISGAEMRKLAAQNVLAIHNTQPPHTSNQVIQNTPQAIIQRRASDPNIATLVREIDSFSPTHIPHGANDSDKKDHLLSTQFYAKTLRLTSDQLKSLNLNSGKNTLEFSVNKGRSIIRANLFKWNCNDSIVVSDIDGTITKSDALGHIMAWAGRDWTHPGVARLYSDIARNGYRIMYLTSRSAGLAETTRNYLENIDQNHCKLPEGPVLLSPDRTFAALRREVVLRKPEVFKMACLRDIQHLFGATKHPFFAGVGNRFTDALSYRSVGIPASRIFTINSYGQVHMDLFEMRGHQSSFIYLNDLVDYLFPPVEGREAVSSEAANFTDSVFWRMTPPPIEPSDVSSKADSDEDDGNITSSEENATESVEGNEEDDYDLEDIDLAHSIGVEDDGEFIDSEGQSDASGGLVQDSNGDSHFVDENNEKITIKHAAHPANEVSLDSPTKTVEELLDGLSSDPMKDMKVVENLSDELRNSNYPEGLPSA